jgi:type VI secretion system protein ImpA
MMAIDLAALLAPVSADAPSGPSVDYDEQYIDLERLARGVPQEEDAEGKVIREAQEPDWREVERIALELCRKSKDLRVAVYLARASLARDGLPGLASALRLVQAYVTEFWPTVHPQLDPADDNDPSIRVNAISALAHNETILRALRATPLTQSRQFGRISYRDYAIATGLMPAAARVGDDKAPPDAPKIEAAFADTPLDRLKEIDGATASSIDCLAAIEKSIAGVIGEPNGPDLAAAKQLLGEIKRLLNQELAKRGGGETSNTGAEGDMAADDSSLTRAEVRQAPAARGPVRSRDDVLLLLDQICRYYADYEPSSPVPLILNRTKRLVTMNFLDIIKELTPGALDEFAVIAGLKKEE